MSCHSSEMKYCPAPSQYRSVPSAGVAQVLANVWSALCLCPAVTQSVSNSRPTLHPTFGHPCPSWPALANLWPPVSSLASFGQLFVEQFVAVCGQQVLLCSGLATVAALDQSTRGRCADVVDQVANASLFVFKRTIGNWHFCRQRKKERSASHSICERRHPSLQLLGSWHPHSEYCLPMTRSAVLFSCV